MRSRPTSPTRGHSADWVGRLPSLWWRSRLPHDCAACWDGSQLPATACHSSWHSRNALRSTPALWPIPSTLPSSIAMAIFSHATNTSALGTCAPTQAPGQYWNAPQSSHRLPPFNECRLECPERKTSCGWMMLLACCSMGSRLWPMPCSKTFFKFSVDRSASLVILIKP